MATDYLALLPTELVIVICDLVHETHPMQYLGRVSKAFLPLERERTFRNLRITSYKSLARLVEAIHTSPGAGVYVATLHLEDRLRRPRDLPLVRDLASFLALLPNLEEVELDALTFSYESPLAAAHLLALIDAIASRTLRAIQIDIYVVHRALSSERDEGIATDEGWTDDLTLEGMVSTVEAADVARVCIYGHAVDRARQEQERRRQAGAAAGRAAG
ncbi:hypothetical protein JCM10450v2_007477 [Rhodotorula kratochvilovae]